MNIIIDDREHKLIEQCKLHLSFDISHLILGDIQFRTEENTIQVIVERKTISDLVSSICDGRYHNQIKRYQDAFSPSQVYYIIEGEINGSYSLPKETLYSALFSLQYSRGFHLLYSKSIQETRIIIEQMYKKLKCSKPYTSSSIQQQDALTTKKDYITKDNIDILMLCQIPNIQYHTAKQLIEIYGTLYNLYSIHEDELKSIKIKTKTKKERKLSKTIVKNIIYYLQHK